MELAEVPKNGIGVGPGIPSFLNTVNGATQKLESRRKKYCIIKK